MSPAMHGFAVKGHHGSFQCQTWQDDRVKQKAEAGVAETRSGGYRTCEAVEQ